MDLFDYEPTRKVVAELKKTGEDFEFYPTKAVGIPKLDLFFTLYILYTQYTQAKPFIYTDEMLRKILRS